MNIPKYPSLAELINLPSLINIIDIGANPIDGTPPYKPLLSKLANIIGFEPNPNALLELNNKKGINELYLPYAIADGKCHKFNICYAGGMSSILEPNYKILDYFHGFSKWGEVIESIEIETRRLDDIDEIKNIDYLKIDIQGAELMVFENAIEKLKDCLIIQTEVEFLPMYINQPLFSEVEIFLRSNGFYFHKFQEIASRVIKPMKVNNNIYSGLSQSLYAEAIFVRKLTDLEQLSSEKLLKLALILNDIYFSYDLVLKILIIHDMKFTTSYSKKYPNFI